MKSLLVACLLSLAGIANASTLAERTKPVLVAISDEDGRVFCSGVWVGPHLVWTKTHCVMDQVAGKTKFNGVGCSGDKMLEQDFLDNALVSTCATAPKVASVALREPTEGEEVYLWGHPLGEGPYWRTGEYIGRWQGEALLPTLQPMMFDFTAAGGDSGGPIFNSKGEVICTASFKRVEPRWPSYAPLGCIRPQFERKI